MLQTDQIRLDSLAAVSTTADSRIKTDVRTAAQRRVCMTEMVSGGLLLARILRAHGQETVYTLHGGHLDAFYVECVDAGITLIDTRHEASAGHAADAHARETGRAATAVVTSGPGFLNVITALGNAKLDRVPMLVIAGAPPLRESETNVLQGGFDQIAVGRPVAKWAYQVTGVERIPETITRALRTAEGGVPGPVLIEIPIDVHFDEVEEDQVRMPKADRPVQGGHLPADQVERIATILSSAARPLIVAGGIVNGQDGGTNLRALAERGSLPVVTSNKAEGSVPSDSPHFAGGLTTVVGLVENGIGPDAVLILGQRQGMFTGSRAPLFGGATVIQVDPDPAELERLADVDIAAEASPSAVVVQLLDAAADQWDGDPEWLSLVQKFRDAHTAEWTDETTSSGRLHPYFAAREIIDASPADAVFVFDGAENASWVTMHARSRRAGDVLRLGYLGGLGIGQGFAIGAQRSTSRPVVLVQGDGAAGFNIAEIDTMVRHKLPIITVIFNNMVWGMSIHGQRAVYGDRGVVVSTMHDTDWDVVAKGFGAYGERVSTLADTGPAMQRAIAHGGPALLNVEIDPDIEHPVTRNMLGDVDNPNEITVPYYQNIQRKGTANTVE